MGSPWAGPIRTAVSYSFCRTQESRRTSEHPLCPYLCGSMFIYTLMVHVTVHPSLSVLRPLSVCHFLSVRIAGRKRATPHLANTCPQWVVRFRPGWEHFFTSSDTDGRSQVRVQGPVGSPEDPREEGTGQRRTTSLLGSGDTQKWQRRGWGWDGVSLRRFLPKS